MSAASEGGLSFSDLPRCGWVSDDAIYQAYHDHEWAVVEHDDKMLFELLILEGFQAGLSWLTILKKRENFRNAFYDWDLNRLKNLSDKAIEKILSNPGIIRNRLKVNAVKKNAQAFIKVQEKFGSFNNFIWGYTEGQVIKQRYDNWRQYPTKSDLSIQISSDLKKLGFSFCGPVIIYSYLQAIGIIDDHMIGCYKAV